MTPTEQDKELFELCKQVYEATGWEPTDWQHGDENGQPLYTSDSLLEKLLEDVRIDKDSSTTYTASKFFFSKNSYIDDIDIEASTQLKALLKLTIALSEAGELNNDQAS